MKEKHYLTPLFEPRSMAVIGASEEEGTVGNVVLRNLIDGGFKGRLFAICGDQEKVLGINCYKTLEEVPQRLDLVVITVSAPKVPSQMESCGRAGVRAVIVMSSGFSDGPRGALLERQMLEAARRHRIRLLGPNSIGLLRPAQHLNASFTRATAMKGSIGLISQSGALCTAVLDWARPNNVGFSTVVSLGSSADIGFGEVLEYMINDSRTESIVLYIEGIRDARRFMSAVRGAARIKPVLLIKAGRHAEAIKTIHAHAGLPSGSDEVFNAALRRAGVIRLNSMSQLFAATNALFAHFRPRGNRLAIVTNGAGPAIMATDRAVDLCIPLAEFSQGTIDRLNVDMPSNWSHTNPVDVLGDADVERYRKAILAVLDDENVDGALVLLSPQANTDPEGVAQALIEIEKKADKPVLPCWMGSERIESSRRAFIKAGIPTFRTPEPAIELFDHISSYYRNQKLLMQTPPSLSNQSPPSIESARLVIETTLMERRKTLNEMESKAVLAAFRIPIAQTVIARTVTEAMVLSEEIGLPVVMKIDSPSIIHKSDSGGVRLNLGSLAAVRSAYQEMLDDVRRNRPDATINGVSIEPMILKRHGRELAVGVRRDPVFGPVITFGEGGSRVTQDHDHAVALPPLNNFLVSDLIRSTPVYPLLGELRNQPAINMEALEQVLLRISEMVCEVPWIVSLDINPLIVDEHGAVAVDASIVVENVSPAADRYDHMAIHPYPSHLITHWTLPDSSRITIRPIKPEDAKITSDFVRELSAESKYLRFMNSLKELPPAMVIRLTQIDYDREIAFIATIMEGAEEKQIGVCRYSVNPDGESCEFAVVVADDWQKRGLARQLMGILIETARNKGLAYMNGVFLANNDRMLRFVQSLGFVLSNDPEDNSVKLGTLALQD